MKKQKLMYKIILKMNQILQRFSLCTKSQFYFYQEEKKMKMKKCLLLGNGGREAVLAEQIGKGFELYAKLKSQMENM